LGNDALIGHGVDKEAVELARQELRTRRLLEDDADGVVRAPAPGLPEKGLDAIVEALPHKDRAQPDDAPSGQGTGCRHDVPFRVVAHTEREELQQLAREVLIWGTGAVLIVVQVDEHGGVRDDLARQLPDVTPDHAAEELVLERQVLRHAYLVVVAGEVVVPEEDHLLARRAFGLHHQANPPLLELRRALTVEREVILPRGHLRTPGGELRQGQLLQQRVHDLLWGLLQCPLHLFGRALESSTAEQMPCAALVPRELRRGHVRLQACLHPNWRSRKQPREGLRCRSRKKRREKLAAPHGHPCTAVTEMRPHGRGSNLQLSLQPHAAAAATTAARRRALPIR
jgi:hypothetical protein